MTFEQFTTNVRQWSTERGIYEHSTAVAQALKACSEAGELCDAVIKGDREALVDSVGDICVCLVNVAEMQGFQIDGKQDAHRFSNTVQAAAGCIARECGDLAVNVGSRAYGDAEENAESVMYFMQALCDIEGIALLECCESAWSEIKDRKGRMVAGGAFVKE
jgi:NTP pyrophosphatase (non-canonical NTP hydrolase)